MKNLYKLIDRAIDECLAVGIEPGEITSVKVNTRAKNRWGQTKYLPDDTFEININKELLEDNVPDKVTMNTVVHEILHTVEGCFNHKKQWQNYADIMNNAYGYNIKRVTSAEEKGLPQRIHTSRTSYRKYVITCGECGHRYYYTRAAKVVSLVRDYGEASGCRCGVCNSTKLYLEDYVW